MDKLWATLSRGKMTVIAVVIAIVLVATPAALAANGKPFLLGKRNVASAVSILIKKGPGPALNLRSQPGQPPLSVNSAVKVNNLNADQLDGNDSSAFVADAVYKRESALDAGTALGDGTFVKAQACDPGDVLLSGGPANINSTSTLLETFPTPGSTTSWSARINKNGQTDNFSVVVLCANQP